MNVIVTDTGFAPEDWTAEVLPVEVFDTGGAAAVGPFAIHLPADIDPDTLDSLAASGAGMIRIGFGHFADGRGFTLAARLRALGYAGRLRAAGHVLADQYAMARRAGFDEVEIDEALARRQPEPQWLARADWRAHDYRARLRQNARVHETAPTA
jgi:uncharacterized protein (DUF934 family)